MLWVLPYLQPTLFFAVLWNRPIPSSTFVTSYIRLFLTYILWDAWCRSTLWSSLSAAILMNLTASWPNDFSVCLVLITTPCSWTSSSGYYRSWCFRLHFLRFFKGELIDSSCLRRRSPVSLSSSMLMLGSRINCISSASSSSSSKIWRTLYIWQ